MVIAQPIQHDKQHLLNMLLWLKATEHKAKKYRDLATMAWMQFSQTVMEIKASGLWLSSGMEWDEYCRERFGVSASRIRQYKGVMPYVDALEDIGLVADETESNLRKLKKVIESDSPLLAPVYQAAHSVANELGLKAPSEAIYKHTYEIMSEANITNHVDVDGAQVPLNTPQAIESAVISSLTEANERNKQRLRGNGGIKVAGMMKRLGNGYQFIPSEACELPDEFEVTIYIKQMKEEVNEGKVI
jgi:hypothetical protein